jgi:hypothetical protein
MHLLWLLGVFFSPLPLIHFVDVLETIVVPNYGLSLPIAEWKGQATDLHHPRKRAVFSCEEIEIGLMREVGADETEERTS